MEKREELNLFILRADEFIEGKYILADIKIVNLLKSIAFSKTLLAIFENCLKDFDYQSAKKKYLVKNKFLSEDKGEFILPPNSRDLLALVFNILMEVDSRQLNLNEFINKYFYVDGSFSSAYAKFMADMIKPFKNSVTMLMESVIEGKIQDPVEALTEAEERSAREKEEQEKEEKQQKELSAKAYASSVNKIRQILLEDKTKIKDSQNQRLNKDELILIIDMLANAIGSGDKDAIAYAFTSYKFMAKAYKFRFFGRVKAIKKYLQEVYDGI